jgi:GNAT superfamily N-acetyltransferase
MSFEYIREAYTISTDPMKLDPETIHHFLSEKAYWAIGRPLEVVKKSIENSLCFGVYLETRQIGFARVVTDYITIAWLCDVFILPEFRGQGLGKWLVTTIIEFPELSKIRRFLLATRDAHGLYQNYGGFKPLENPDTWLERFRPNSFSQ